MDSLTNQCKRISTRLLPPGLVFSTEGRTKGGWAGLRPELAWLVRAETPARRRSDGRLPSQSRGSNRLQIGDKDRACAGLLYLFANTPYIHLVP